jgi:hypothetical protein
MWVIGGTISNTPADIYASYDGMHWELISSTAGVLPRSSGEAVSFDGYMWVLGGFDGSDQTSDVWRSADGSSWTKIATSGVFSKREAHRAVVHGGYMWAIGGWDFGVTPLSDVWRSSNGVNWTQMTGSAAFGGRLECGVTSYDGKLWVIGGFSNGSNRNDVWWSSDGVAWNLATGSAPFGARRHVRATTYDGKMWVIGGKATGGAPHDDVWWSTDGVNWTQATGNAESPAVYYHDVVVFDEKMWRFGGITGSVMLNDVYYSSNGANWERTGGSTFPVGSLHAMAAFQGKLWSFSHSDFSGFDAEIWSSENGWDWTLEDDSPNYSGALQTCMNFNGQLWMIGGSGSPDVGVSSDGVNWSTADSFVSGSFGGSGHRSVVYDGKMWVIGGDGATVYSSSNGTTWDLETSSPPFGQRRYHGLAEYDGRMWLIGGGQDGGSSYKNDVWWSEDGTTWTLATASAPFSARRSPSVAAFNGKLWVYGGFTGTQSVADDVWSTTEGTTWVQESIGAPFPGRASATPLVWNDQLWFFGGAHMYFSNLVHHSDNWYLPLASKGYRVTPEELSFGAMDIDDMEGEILSVDVQSTGTEALNFAGSGISMIEDGGGAFVLEPSPDLSAMEPWEVRRFLVGAIPNELGFTSGVLLIETDAPDGITTVALTATGAEREIEVAPLSLSFGARAIEDGATSGMLVTITNISTVNLAFSGDEVSLAGASAGQFQIVGDSGESILGSGESRLVSIAYHPLAPGGHGAMVVITSNDPDEGAVEVVLDGASGYRDAWVDFDYDGTQVGTQAQPVNTLSAAEGVVHTGGTVHIQAGQTSETPRITKAMRLEAEGESVRIGEGGP